MMGGSTRGRHDRAPGFYRGRIVAYEDGYRGRATLEVPEVYGAGVPSPPAKMGGMMGGNMTSFGEMWLPPEGASVWVFFEFGGNIQCPVWIPGWITAREGDSDVPDFAQEKDDLGDVPFRGSDKMTDFDDQEFVEPGPVRVPEYPKARGFRSESGHLIVMDDSDDGEVMQMVHKDGSMLEWSPGGSELHRVLGRQWESLYGNVFRHYRGDVHEVYEGKRRVTYRGDKEEKIVGSFKQIRQGDIQNELQGSLNQTFGTSYVKQIGQETRSVLNNRAISVVGQELKGVGKDWGVTIGEFGSIQVSNNQQNETAFAIAAMSGKVALQTVVNPLTGDPLTHVTVSDSEAKMEGPIATMKGTGSAEVDAPSVDIGTTAATVRLGGGGPGCARQGDTVTGTASLGMISLPVTATIVGGSTKVTVG